MLSFGETLMFNTLESNWDESTHRGWTALASFTMLALGLSLLLAIPLIWVQKPPEVQWLQRAVPGTFASPPVREIENEHPVTGHAPARHEQVLRVPSVARTFIFNRVVDLVPAAPELPGLGNETSPEISNRTGRGAGALVPGGLGEIPVVQPSHSAVVGPVRVSHLSEANLLFRVQPIYPPIARQARVQGMVELRAVISKAGTIENLTVVSGHPMLVKGTVDAVRQWRYRPYLLNNDPVEVETEITVTFVLAGS
jgi:protein TonB